MALLVLAAPALAARDLKQLSGVIGTVNGLVGTVGTTAGGLPIVGGVVSPLVGGVVSPLVSGVVSPLVGSVGGTLGGVLNTVGGVTNTATGLVGGLPVAGPIVTNLLGPGTSTGTGTNAVPPTIQALTNSIIASINNIGVPTSGLTLNDVRGLLGDTTGGLLG
ncbi:hypothetical protein MNEG_15100 [Monoraphidium neglectum]|uniref:Uncharacterized protein n=1 Tax=Monoraphidium neglectum TaxID=145388 RepID=A0A0D2K9X8_9CHLO|nr:hypothetical protein MNEG_15100 [Monoraphidium neglectum]KIY92863.1 hypothetical protein MNEG_15100 [Monoraphidium neglectum]|eukprot:XP_013891883.1 hypothetical protein MNEG_15100 [Monoraphidium neglectum]